MPALLPQRHKIRAQALNEHACLVWYMRQVNHICGRDRPHPSGELVAGQLYSFIVIFKKFAHLGGQMAAAFGTLAQP
jgi:hypothetical protein